MLSLRSSSTGKWSANKHRNLLRAYWALLAGFVPLVVAVVYYLRLLDGPS
ncbi:MAG: hypothetical protein ACYDHX_14500 [Methanothrix sp.]